MSNECDISRILMFDYVEYNVFFFLFYFLSQYILVKIDFDGVDYLILYKGGKKVLMIGIDECYILMQNGSMFFIGNYLVEMFLLMYYLDKVGFEFDVVMFFGNLVKLEMWVMFGEDEVVKSIYVKYLFKLKVLWKFVDFLEQVVVDDLLYVVVFVFGGYGVLVGILYSWEVKWLFNVFFVKDCYIIIFCYGLVCLLVLVVDEKLEDYLFKGYEICVFFDVLDIGVNLEIGYMFGFLFWLVGENLQKFGVKIFNKGIIGQVYCDCKLFIGDSLLVFNNFGKLVVKIFFEVFVC